MIIFGMAKINNRRGFMAYTYNEILERMNDKFEELSGYSPDRVSDIGIRIKLLAGELYSLCTEIDGIKKQMFPNTATGEYLDRHAHQRGLSRIKGNKATGFVVFRLDTPLDYDITIPRGTVCSNSDGSLRYVTISDDTIPRESSYKLIECEAIDSGERYNTGSGTVKVIMTYFSVGMSITNATSFIGGTDDESDDELRGRIAQSYLNTPNGANAEYYINLAKSVDGIKSATVASSSAGSITVCVGGEGDVPSNTAYQTAHDILNAGRPFGISLSVTRPELVTVNVTAQIDVKDGFTANEVIANAQITMTNFFKKLGVGEDVKLAALGKALYETSGVDNYEFTNMSDVSISVSQLAKLGTVSITAPNA